MVSRRSGPSKTSPLYTRVASTLRDQIESGEMRPHDPVPSERALSERFGVSRMTARQAVQTLMHEGYVYRRQRRGTFVAEPRLQFSVGSFTRTMTAEGHIPGTEILNATTLAADPLVAEALGVRPGAAVHLLQRLRSVESEPIAIENIYVSAERFPDLLDHDVTGSLWGLLGRRYGVHPSSAQARVMAATLDRFEAQALGVSAGTPAIVLTRTVLGDDGLPVELARDVYRGDRTEFRVTAPVDGVAGAVAVPPDADALPAGPSPVRPRRAPPRPRTERRRATPGGPLAPGR